MKNLTVLAGPLAVIMGMGLFFVVKGRPTRAIAGVTIMTERPEIPIFSLTSDTGEKVTNQDFNQPWIGAFVFSNCGTQCPMMGAKMKRLRREVPGLGAVSFSVDPGDTPAKLAKYKRGLGADWTFLTGGPGVVRKLCIEGFKLPVADGTTTDDPILHSKNLVLVDKKNRIVGYFDSDDPVSIKALIRTAKGLL